MENKTTYVFIKDGVAMAFEGTERPTIERSVSYSSKVEWGQYDYEMETAKASALPIESLFVFHHHYSIHNDKGVEFVLTPIEGNEPVNVKEGEVVPLEGWRVEKVYEYEPNIFEGWKECSEHEWYSLFYLSKRRQAYRLVRSEPTDIDSIQWQDIMTTAAGIKPEQSPIEAKTQESQEEPFSMSIQRDLQAFIPKLISGELGDSIKLGYVQLMDGKRVEVNLKISVS